MTAESFTEHCWPVDVRRYGIVADYLDEWGEETVIAQYQSLYDAAHSEAGRSYERALYEIARLCLQAREGDTEAAECLARLAVHATAALNRVAQIRPARVTDFSSHWREWPVIKGRHKELSPSEQALFRQIKLGEAAFIELDAATAKWKMDDAGKAAYRLLCHLITHRRVVNAPSKSAKKVRLTAWSAAVKRLPDFSEASASEWWNVAHAFILKVCPEPQSVPELNALVTSPSKRKSQGRMKQAILEILKRRFLSFAPNPYHT
jgi:hypothetical protein